VVVVSAWTTRTEELSRRALELRWFEDDRALRFADVFALLQQSHEFRGAFIERLAAVPFESYRWELPAVTSASVERAFECVVIDAPGLAPVPDEDAFAEHFERGVEGVVVFENLGKDATLVVPCPITDPTAYNHLAVFLRRAPEVQKHALLRRLGESAERVLGRRPVWISTAGAGVSWLHVRLDARPKYYVHTPYKTAEREP
jgi:hypothetical protein